MSQAQKHPIPADAPLTKQLVVAAFIEGVHSLGVEVDAWRRFGSDVSAFLKAKGLAEEFQAWRDGAEKWRDGAEKRPLKRKR